MASLSSRRLANSITWTLNFTTRSRTIAVSFTSTEHARHRRHRSHQRSHFSNPSSRQFSSLPFLLQEAGPSQEAPSAPKPPPYNSTARASTGREPPPSTARNDAARQGQEPIRELTRGLSDVPTTQLPEEGQIDWTRSFHGLSTEAFSKEARDVLLQPVNIDDIEIKAEGLIYLPEIKYRRILNKAFGPGGWGLAPRGETIVTAKCVTREYALVVNGRLVSIARGEQDYFDSEGIPTATEGCKSNALMRCCKDLGIASELWDPRFIRNYFKKHAKEIWVEHVVTKKKRKMTMRKDDEVRYPFKEVKGTGASGTF